MKLTKQQQERLNQHMDKVEDRVSQNYKVSKRICRKIRKLDNQGVGPTTIKEIVKKEFSLEICHTTIRLHREGYCQHGGTQ